MQSHPVELPDPEAPRIFFAITPHFRAKCWSCKKQNAIITKAAFSKPSGYAISIGATSDYWCFVYCSECAVGGG